MYKTPRTKITGVYKPAGAVSDAEKAILQKRDMDLQNKAKKLNSPVGLAMETVKGLPKAAVDLGKKAVKGVADVGKFTADLGKAFVRNTTGQDVKKLKNKWK